MPAINGHNLLATWTETAHQQVVDTAQARIRAELAAGRRSLFKPAPARPARSDDVLDNRLAEELEFVSRQIGQIGDVLANDPILLQRHAAQLQSIDLVQQILAQLGRVIASSDRAAEVDCITLTDLKARLTRKPLRPDS